MSANTEDGDRVVWKHIGLYGHSVGSFICDEAGILWKSAIMGSDNGDVSSSTKREIPADMIQGARWTVFGRSGHLRLQTKGGGNLKHELRFDGFPVDQVETLKATLKDKYSVELRQHNMSSAGTQYGLPKIQSRNLVFRHCILEDADEEGEEYEAREGDEMLSLDLTEVSQCVLPGNNRSEIELQYPESDTIEAGTDQLIAVRFYIPPDPDVDPHDKSIQYPAEILQQKIMQTANVRKAAGDVVVQFPQSKGTFLTPRGRYAIELHGWFFRMRGQKYDYKIKYDDISRLFLLPKPDEVHMAFVIALDKPIRQGQQRYQYLVLQATKDPDEVQVNLDEETLEKEYGGELQPLMRGSLSNVLAKTFKIITKKKVFIPGKFANANQQACVKCALRANEGLLYPLEKQFVFIHKPPILIRFTEVESVEFQRYAGGQGSTRNFDLCVNLKANAVAGGVKEYTFSGVDRSDYAGLYNFLNGKKIKIKNLEDVGGVMETQRIRTPVYNEDEIYGGPDLDGEEESEDESYDANAKKVENEGSDSTINSEDDEDLGSEVDEDLDSDLEDARKGSKKSQPAKKKGASKKRPTQDSDDDDNNSDSSDAEGDRSPKKKKAKKDPNAPKKPLSAYMLFSNAKRAAVKEESPDLSFGEIAKSIGKMFKQLSSEERELWDQKARESKKRYQEALADYDPPSDMEEDTKKKAKKTKDPNAPKKALSAYMYFVNKNRAKIKAANPDLSFGDLSRKIGKEFKALTASEKEQYDKMAKQDKERYQKDMKNYTPPKGASAAAAGKKGKKKDPNAPKRALTSFMYFSNTMRDKVKKDNPGISFGEVGKKLGEAFKALDSDEKQKYIDMANKDKERYSRDMNAYSKKGGDDSDSDDDDDDDDDVKAISEEDDDDDDDDDSD